MARRSMPGRARLLATALVMLMGSACTFDEKVVSVPRAQVVVHAVLNPGSAETSVLVEQTLTGTVTIREGQRYDPDDPIRSAGGLPISGADVAVTGPDGELRGREFLLPAPAGGTRGTGRYVLYRGAFGSILASIRRGARYTLRVRTPDGTVVTGTTLVPNAVPFVPGSKLEAFNRDRDSLRLAWSSVAGARTYLIRVDTPFGPYLSFSDSTRLVLPGNLRNFFAPNLERTFIPGFRQRFTLAAVDSNFYDYYRSRNDPFTGSGIINRLQGGIGLFGAAVSIDVRTLDVSQDAREPTFEGEYEAVQTPTLPRPVADIFRLYVETPGEPAALSGWFARNRSSGVLEGLIGARVNGRIVIEFLENQNALDTVAVFRGVASGDSLIGDYVGVNGRVVFRRRASSRAASPIVER
jgi:hypothetical protein